MDVRGILDSVPKSPRPADLAVTERRSIRGSSLVGLLAFLFGLAMIVIAFKLAWDLFSIPPEVRLDIKQGEPIDAGNASQTLLTLLVKVLMLVVMAGFGSMVANRGVRLYAATGAVKPEKKKGSAKDSGSKVEE
ncbi:hypothetical protein QPK87_31735 [Kamptonema cortianum]|nr:hypothetical protein [Geitlerinema splendidum]MDK3161097.1 hypothetical protein [Kamptonema cortianum]